MIKRKPIAVISMVRNDTFFADKWIAYYGNQFGFEHLYLFIDGMDQKLPVLSRKINCYQIPHVEYSRAKGDRKRAQYISKYAATLFQKYEVVLAMDIDEFLVLDPATKLSLSEYLSQGFSSSSLSALGLDVGQHPEQEAAIDLKQPFLSQRAYAEVSDRYTKPVVALKPLQWGSGFHRIKGKNFTIDPHLFLFHFGLVDLVQVQENIQNEQLLSSGWKGHFERRFELYQSLKKDQPQEGDFFFKKARMFFAKQRKWYAWNKPAPLKGNALVEIPKRFETLV
ncbi:glycosyltransferase family 2 protein [Flavobacteriaceae bacterium]|nr:glycosyltransferase family 2 protein [Flavobacteriaceae bacterium]